MTPNDRYLQRLQGPRVAEDIAAAEFYLLIKQGSWSDPPADPQALEGQMGAPLPEVLGALKLAAEQAVSLKLAYDLYESSVSAPWARMALQGRVWVVDRTSRELMNLMSRLGGGIHIDPPQPPPADQDPATILPRVVRAEQELVAALRGVISMLGENASAQTFRSRLPDHLQSITELQYVPAAVAAPMPPGDPAAMLGDPSAAPPEPPPEEGPSETPVKEANLLLPGLAALGGAVGGGVAGAADRGTVSGAFAGALGAGLGAGAGALGGDIVAAFMPGVARQVAQHGAPAAGALAGYQLMMNSIKTAAVSDMALLINNSRSLHQQQRNMELAGQIARGKVTPEIAAQQARSEGYQQTMLPIAAGTGLGAALVARTFKASPLMTLGAGALGALAGGATVGHWAGNAEGERAVDRLYGTGAIKTAFQKLAEEFLADPAGGIAPGSDDQIDPAQYIQQELQARQAQEQNESGFYRKQLEQSRQQSQQLQEQLAQQQQELEAAQQQQAMSGAEMARIQEQAMAAEDKALQATSAAAQMRMAQTRMRQQMMDMASQDPDQMAAQSIQQQLQEQQQPLQEQEAAAQQAAMQQDPNAAAQDPNAAAQDPNAQAAPQDPNAAQPKTASGVGDALSLGYKLVEPELMKRGPYAAVGALGGLAAPIPEHPLAGLVRKLEQDPDADPTTVAKLREASGVDTPRNEILARLRNALVAGSGAGALGPALKDQGLQAIDNAKYFFRGG